MTKMLHQFASEVNKNPKEIIELIQKMKKKGTSFSFTPYSKDIRVLTELDSSDISKIKKELESSKQKTSENKGSKKVHVVRQNGKKIRLRKKKKEPKVSEVKETEVKSSKKEIKEMKEKESDNNLLQQLKKEQRNLKKDTAAAKKSENTNQDTLRKQKEIEEKAMQNELKKIQEELKMKRELERYKKESDLKKLGDGYQGNKGGYQGNKSGYQGNKGGYQGNKGGYQGNKGGYQGSKGGYQGNNDNKGGYQGNKGGYQGNKGGYQGNNDNKGGYQGNKGGYQGSKGGYQGNNDNKGGYQGNKGGYQGNKGGYQGNKTGSNDAFEGKKDTQKNKVQKKYVDKFNKNKRKTKNKSFNVSQLEAMGGYTRKRKKRKVKKVFKKTEITVASAHKRIIKLSQDTISVGNLAKEMNIKAAEIVAYLFKEGTMVTVNEFLDLDTASLIATEFNYEIQEVSFDIADILEKDISADEKGDEVTRAPIVTVMGHVDHGKTKLLDTIRHTKVADGEAGGITQHVGSYSVETPNGRITFLDTPGHEAFTSMRARGANVTDIIILIVAADDGIMPQTIEAINHAKAAKVPIIVAINKIDKNNIDINRVKTELMSHELLPEEYGGDTIVCEISAKQNIGIEDLLEVLALQAEVLELKAVIDMPARATVIEAFVDKGRGTVANILVQEGTLKVGDFIVAGEFFGKVKAMYDDSGKRVKTAGPSTPVAVVGLNGVPNAGEPFNATLNEKSSREIAAHFQKTRRDEELRRRAATKAEDLFQQFADDSTMKELRVVLKADVQGSVEAVKAVLVRTSNDKVKINVIHAAVGGITENDVTLAMASNAMVIGFNVKPATGVKMQADNSGVELRLYSIIYKMEEDVQRIALGLLDPIFREETIGQAEIREVFNITKVGKIAGCMVKTGKIARNANMRIIREDIIIADDKLKSLKRFKDDVKEVKFGYECGISLEKFTDIKPGDILEAYIIIEERITKL